MEAGRRAVPPELTSVYRALSQPNIKQDAQSWRVEEPSLSAPDKLTHLLQLADQGPALRLALAEEVADLLADWPGDYPQKMREVCEALLAKTVRDLDVQACARLRVQLCSQPRLVQRVLPRDTATPSLIEAARSGQDLAAALADYLGVDWQVANDILGDESGAKLALACKGASMERATFSALALLSHPARDRGQIFGMLDRFDAVAAGEASRCLRDWQCEGERLSA